ncbi:hypothetical protein [Tunicatimonas pelagia]|uniref:hypothetical protein n=1 Tax=Tunicatimonas pelagia TaxID=931531 RepID=UPI0026665985|nr:hypothetical protein [Tunicatimonas pelagia]WKN41769.1 hypothetical protein P0M28_22280 [Tunicatimonas pelagia]
MRTILSFFVAILLVASTSTFAQKYRPAEYKVQFDKTTASAWVVSVDEEPLDALKKSWSAYVRQELNVKSKKDGRSALIAKEVTIPRIAESTGDLRARFYTENNESQMAVAFTTGYSTSINTEDSPEEAENLRQLTKNFVKYYKTNSLNGQIAQYEKREKSLTSSYGKNEREQKQLTKRVAKVEKQMKSDKSDENKKFDLKNEKIADESRMAALDAIMVNQKKELIAINKTIQQLRADISYLETLFAEPVAKKNVGQ